MPAAFDGLLVLDKPLGITSRDAVDRAARWFPRSTRLGHTGTLDPLATGVLVLCVGSATKLVEYVQDMPKAYHSVFRLGATSETDDAEGTLTPTPDAREPERAAVEAALARWVGDVEQVPPAFSAAKVAGKRSYALARRGEEVVLTPRRVRVDRITLLRYAYPDVELEVHCGKGTYIRSLARDVGQQLGCGGHVATLRRTRVGPFQAADAVPLTTPREEAQRRLLPPGQALVNLPRVVLPGREVDRLRHGQPVIRTDLPEGEVAVFDEGGAVVAIGRADPAARLLRPAKVLG